ncbi:hypothetical protein NAI48_11385, partial [Francisella tularensis subsp. holarctica]|nr:hypothetical protein [Francisella tularensis subsp. holarctica]
MLNLKTNVFSLTHFALSGQVNIAFGLLMSLGSFLGGIACSTIVILKGSKLVRQIYINFVVEIIL